MSTLARPGFARRAAAATLLALGLAVVLVVATADGPDAVSGGLGGDFPAFYAAGDIVLDDPGLDPDEFYEPDRQFEAQEPAMPSDSDGHLFFGYPAFFVAPFVPLAALEFRLAYLVDLVVMVGALLATWRLLRPCSRVTRDHGLEAFAAAVTFFPLFRGISGGQNTALSVLLFAVVWRSLHDDREVPAGIAAGLLLFKPPLALPLLGGLLLARRFGAVVSAAVTGAALYVVGAVLTGWSWPSAWLDAVEYLDEVDTPFNVDNFVSLPGAAEAVFGIDSTAASVVGWGLTLPVVLWVAWAWFRRAPDIGALVVFTAAGALLISPHALYYDAGLLVLAAVVLADRGAVGPMTLAALWVAGLSHLLADELGFSPLVFMVAAGFVLTGRLVERSLHEVVGGPEASPASGPTDEPDLSGPAASRPPPTHR